MEIIKEGLLKVDPGLLLWTLITFLILLLILWKAAWKPIVNALDSRAEKVRNDIDHAENTRQEAEKVLVEYKTLLANSKEESANIITRAKEDGEKIQNAIVEKATKEAQEILERTKKELAIAKENALNALKADIVLLSTEIASKIIERNLNPEDQSSIVRETLNRIETVQ
ncbi:MAG: F0F1 ATP synthase subunit B [Leptospirales bacterium]|nr:F0F1 ATP synthase subunit B [Leptospirales bacterium]